MPHWLIAVIAVVLIGGLYLVSFWKTAKDEKARKILEQEELDQDREAALKKKAEYLARKAAIEGDAASANNASTTTESTEQEADD